MKRLTFFILLCFWLTTSSAQYTWKLSKEKNGISVYLSDIPGKSLKAVKVECTLTGTFAKLIAILSNVAHMEDWVFHNKKSKMLKQNTPLDFIYYTETSMPFPLSNRDAIIHIRIKTDSLPKFLTITGTGEPDFFPKIPTKVRVPHYKASWKVTMPSANKIQIYYIVEVDPGGSIPAWISNMFADDGPYGSFSNLAEELKK